MFHVKHSILFNTESGYSIKLIKQLKLWLAFVCLNEHKQLFALSYNFISDEDLRVINIDRLGHDYYTDIITFDLSDNKETIEGDIYISYDRVKENAKVFHVKHSDELRRVLVHGLLHLIGYKDKSKNQKELMRAKEDEYLSIYNSKFAK